MAKGTRPPKKLVAELTELGLELAPRNRSYRVKCPDGAWVFLGYDIGSKVHEANLRRDLKRHGVVFKEETKDQQVEEPQEQGEHVMASTPQPVDDPIERLKAEQETLDMNYEQKPSRDRSRPTASMRHEARMEAERQIYEYVKTHGRIRPQDAVKILEEITGHKRENASGAVRMLNRMAREGYINKVAHDLWERREDAKPMPAPTQQPKPVVQATSTTREVQVSFLDPLTVQLQMPITTYAELLPVLEEFLRGGQ